MPKKRVPSSTNSAPKPPKKDDSVPSTNSQTGTSLSVKALTFFVICAALALSWHASKIQLAPLYGSSAASMYFTESLTAILLLSSFMPSNLLPELYVLPGLSGWMTATPVLLQTLGSTLGRRIKNPLWGAAGSYVFALGPATILLQSVARNVLVSQCNSKRNIIVITFHTSFRKALLRRKKNIYRRNALLLHSFQVFSSAIAKFSVQQSSV